MFTRTPKEGEAHDLVRLAAAVNPFQAHIWQQALEEEGIHCQVLGDYLDAGVGDIPGIGAEVWVEAADLDRAEAILRRHKDHGGEAAPPTKDRELQPVERDLTMSTPTNQRILVAVDESEVSRRAVDYVADMLGGRHGFHVGLVHLELPPRMLEWGGSEDSNVEDEISSERAEAYRELEEKTIENGQRMLEKLKGILTERGIDVTAPLVRLEEPLDRKHIAHDVLNIAKERDYGTIVVGCHSFSGLKRLFQHHVGEELVRTAKGVTIWVVA